MSCRNFLSKLRVCVVSLPYGLRKREMIDDKFFPTSVTIVTAVTVLGAHWITLPNHTHHNIHTSVSERTEKVEGFPNL